MCAAAQCAGDTTQVKTIGKRRPEAPGHAAPRHVSRLGRDRCTARKAWLPLAEQRPAPPGRMPSIIVQLLQSTPQRPSCAGNSASQKSSSFPCGQLHTSQLPGFPTTSLSAVLHRMHRRPDVQARVVPFLGFHGTLARSMMRRLRLPAHVTWRHPTLFAM